jgi:hypothetical protein
MRLAVCGVLGFSLVVGFSGSADAGAKKKQQRYHPAQRAHVPKRPSAEQGSDYYEHIADKLPIGSRIWWDQMMIERRGGRPG